MRWNVDTLLELMNERDRRYSEQRRSDQEAVRLAKEVADKAKGTVSIAILLGVLSLLLTLADYLK